MRRLFTKSGFVLICVAVVAYAAAWATHSKNERDRDPYSNALEQLFVMGHHPGRRGDRALRKFEQLLEQHPELTQRQPAPFHDTILFNVHWAGEAYARRVVNAVVDHGGDVNFQSDFGETPLTHAALFGLVATESLRMEIVRALVDRGAELNLSQLGGKPSPGYFTAIFRGHIGIVEIFLSRGAAVSTGPPFFESALDWVCFSNAVKEGTKTESEMNQMIDLLVRYGAPITHPLTNDPSPVAVAIEDDNLWVVEHLAMLPGLDVPGALRIARSAMQYKYKNDSPQLGRIIATLEARLADMPQEPAKDEEAKDKAGQGARKE